MCSSAPRGAVPLLFDPSVCRMQQDLLAFVSEMMHAAREGFDGVALTEHGQSSYDVMPNPNLIAATLATMTQLEGVPAAISVLGRSLGKSREPLRVAEEYAMIDCLSGEPPHWTRKRRDEKLTCPRNGIC